MGDTRIVIIHPVDPFGRIVGGVNSFLKGFIKYSPEDLDIGFIGVTSDRGDRPLRKWSRRKMGNKEFDFLPLVHVRDENKKKMIPLSLRFTLALLLFRPELKKDMLFFNRIEPALVFGKTGNPKIAVVHANVQKEVIQDKSEQMWHKFPRLYFFLERLIFAGLEHIYVVSKDVLDFYLARYPEQEDKFSFLPTWVDNDIFYPAAEDKSALRGKLIPEYPFLPAQKRWILFVGRLQKVKRPDRLIDAFIERSRTNDDACLIIIGEGNLRGAIKQHIKRAGIEDKVFLLGNMDQRKLVDFYRASDLLLLTSNFEGMPISVLEALGCGLPVVTTAVGEVRRVVKNGISGEVVESFSPQDIAGSVDKVLSGPGLYTKENCSRSVSEYVPQKVLEPVYELIRELRG